jgi:NADH:ubiquinone oxidoreductase subunit 3 (subunit A)
MEKFQNIKAFTEWNNEQIFSVRFMLRLLILNIIFSGGIYLLAGVAKVNTELSVFKWVCTMLGIFLTLMTFYLLINFKRKRAGLSLFYAMTMVNLSLAFGGMGLYIGFL